MRKQKRQQEKVAILFAMFLLIVIFVAVFVCNRMIGERMEKELDNRLEEVVAANLMSFDLQMNEQIKKVNTFAQILGNSDTIDGPEQVELLKAAVENNGLLRCAIAFPDGTFITHDNTSGDNVSNDAWFKASMAGQFFITDPRPAVVDPSKTVILFSAPIRKDGQVIGCVIYSYLCTDMERIFNLNFMEDKGKMVVVNKEGNLLIGESSYVATGENLLEALRAKCSHEDHKASECGRFEEKGGTIRFSLENQDVLHLRYDSLLFNDWVMVSAVPESAASKATDEVMYIQWIMGAVIFISTLLYFAFLLATWTMRHRNVDKLTRALTLDGFKRKVRKLLRNSTQQQYVILQLDVKNFKLINRIYDYSVGDKVIQSMADALRITLADLDATFARVSVDNFLVFVPYHGADWLQKRRIAFIENFKSQMGEAFSSMIIFPTGQYVLSVDDVTRIDVSELIEKVNFAHRKAKQNFEGIVDYKETIEKEALLEKRIEDRMSRALNEEEFVLYLQPKFALETDKICGAEALVRWRVDGEYYMYPTDFIPILERNGFIVQLDMYMFELSVKNLRRTMDEGKEPYCVSVNFSRHHLGNRKFVEELREIADKYEIPHKYLEIEITESALFNYIEPIKVLIKELHANGFGISMDDFGSGYSSLAQIAELHVDVIKLDREFLEAVHEKKRTQIVVSSVIRMANELGVTTVGEGIETKEQLDMLKELKCDIGQGFYLARPMPAAKMDDMLSDV